MKKELKGAFTALLTPFRNYEIDFQAFQFLIENQIQNGIHGLVTCGSTGEAATMSEAELKRMFEFTVKTVNGRVPVIAGTGSNDTHKTIKMTQYAKEIGVDAALVVVPYYNKPTQEGLIQHFTTVAEKTDFPIILYNIPTRTSLNMNPETVLKLSEIANIVGLKDGGGNLIQTSEIARHVRSSFQILSGDDPLTYFMMTIGATGVISVSSNLIPKQVSRFIEQCLNKDWEKARFEHLELLTLHQTMFIETNPIPVKYAVSLIHSNISAETRLPLTELTESSKTVIKDLLKSYRLVV